EDRPRRDLHAARRHRARAEGALAREVRSQKPEDAFWLLAPSSVDVALVALRLLQFFDILTGPVGGHAAVAFDDAAEFGIDVCGHALLVAADEELGPIFQPRPDVGAVLAHAVLDVHLGRLVA